jgi:hypothetical protein
MMLKILEARVASQSCETVIHVQIHQVVLTLSQGSFQPVKCLLCLAK